MYDICWLWNSTVPSALYGIYIYFKFLSTKYTCIYWSHINTIFASWCNLNWCRTHSFVYRTERIWDLQVCGFVHLLVSKINQFNLLFICEYKDFQHTRISQKNVLDSIDVKLKCLVHIHLSLYWFIHNCKQLEPQCFILNAGQCWTVNDKRYFVPFKNVENVKLLRFWKINFLISVKFSLNIFPNNRMTLSSVA